MRFVGKVEVVDYLENVVLQKRESVISLYHAYGEDILVLQNPYIKAGVTYKLSAENVLQACFGVPCKRKLTIRFKEPSHELRIYNHMILIQSFGNLVKFLCKAVGPSQIAKRSGMQKQLEDFKNIPRNLKVLKLHHIEMDYLPDSVAELQQLYHLEIVNGNLAEIPVFVGTLPCLSVLNLARNRLGVGSNWEFLTNPLIKENLRQLDLQHNEMQIVPNEVVKLHGLLILHLDYNLLVSIPNATMEMTNLRVLSISNNRMRIFPYNLFPLDSFSLDLSNNPFISYYFVISKARQSYDVPTLKELASRAVTDYRLPASLNTLPRTVVEYLQTAQYCEICMGSFFESYFPCRFISYSRIYIEIVPEREYLHNWYDLRYMCSRRCMQPELKFCEVLNHLTPCQYDNMVHHIF